MKFNVRNIAVSGIVGSILSYTAALNDLQGGSMLIGAILGVTMLYAHTLQKQVEDE